MALITLIKRNLYQDSVQLMRISKQISDLNGIEEAVVIMATDTNMAFLREIGLYSEEAKSAASGDILIVIKAQDEHYAKDALKVAHDELLGKRKVQTQAGGTDYPESNTLEEAVKILPEVNIILVSVPGEYAALVTKRSLELNRDVMLFSDNVPLEDEINLKHLAQKKDLLLMGPDCGTAIINGVGLGFANSIKRGNIGIVGASGTGIQELTILIDRMGSGVSHALGTGSRDLNEKVGGISMVKGIDLLEEDESTEIIVVISKLPDPIVAQRITERIKRCKKSVVVNFLGLQPHKLVDEGFDLALTIEEAALFAVHLSAKENKDAVSYDRQTTEGIGSRIEEAISNLKPKQKYIRGLYCGGTLAYESLLILQEELGVSLFSNTPLPRGKCLEDPWRPQRNSIIDLGDDLFTRGRPHPIINSEIRDQLISKEFNDPNVAVIMLDIILGYGAHEDPSGKLAELLNRIQKESKNRPIILSHVCGTEADVQILSRQEQVLRRAGVEVCESNARMARIALEIIHKITQKKQEKE